MQFPGFWDKGALANHEPRREPDATAPDALHLFLFAFFLSRSFRLGLFFIFSAY
jgi:hypothetical protein